MNVLETDRLSLSKFTVEDAPFILKLVNDPSWLRFIGDRGVHNLEDAQKYILNGPVSSYELFGFGLYLVKTKRNEVQVGMCGLIKRDFMEDVDIGYAFLPDFWGIGYAQEAAVAVLEQGKRDFRLKRIVAVVSPDNRSSIKLLKKLGFHFEKMVKFLGDEEEIELYAREE
jgi:RimJ/RimL family protein N-acetyltransferase